MADAQRKQATVDLLLKKRRIEKEVTVSVPGDEPGTHEELALLFRSIGAQEYDRLVSRFPPTMDQKKQGMVYDIDRFAPELLSRVCVDPPLSADEAKAIWSSDDWNRAEVMTLFTSAIEVCNKTADLDPTDSV